MSEDRLLEAAEVAALFNVPVSWVRTATRSGYLPHVRFGKYVRYRREDVVGWLEDQVQGGAAWRKHKPQVPA